MKRAKPLDTEFGKTVIVPPTSQVVVQDKNSLMNAFAA
jgi:hypothetical protein